MSVAVQQDAEKTVYQSRAVYDDPANAFDFELPHVPRRQFVEERDRAFDPAVGTCLIELDASDVMETNYPATTPSILARYVKIKAGEGLVSDFKASGAVYYVMHGRGDSRSRDDVIAWGEGDVFCLPGGPETHHHADTDALLFCVTNEPLLSYEGLLPGHARFDIAHWTHAEIERRFQTIWAREQTADTAGFALQFSNPALAPARITIPSINSAINTLHPGGDQRPHRHNGVAITLAIQGEGVFSMIEEEKVPWVTGAAQITPATELHSHHNQGSQRMRSFVVQDEGLHYYLRTPGFSWT